MTTAKYSPKVLVVEDDEVLRLIIQQVCESRGCKVRTAADGREALRLLHSERFSLVISDVRMPQMDGVTLLKTVQKEGLDTPVILMSGYTDYTAAKVEEFGGVVLIEKPFSKSQLEELVDGYALLLPVEPAA